MNKDIVQAIEKKIRALDMETINEVLEDWYQWDENNHCPFAPDVIKIITDIDHAKKRERDKILAIAYNAMHDDMKKTFFANSFVMNCIEEYNNTIKDAV